MNTFQISRTSSTPLNSSFGSGANPTLHCVNYAQLLKTLCLTIHTGGDIYLRAHIDTLVYDVTNSAFDGQLFGIALAGVDPTSPFYDPSLANIDSPFLSSLES